MHIIHHFDDDFYGQELRVLVLGYIRPEKNYNNVDELIKDIRNDMNIAITSLEKPEYSKYKMHEIFQ